MSYLFDGANDTLTGTFTSTYASSGGITLAVWIKFTDHPIALDAVLSFGESASSQTNSHIIRLTSVDNTFAMVSNNSANASVVKTGIDATWVPYIGVYQSATSRQVYISDVSDTNATSDSVADTLQFIRFGESLTAANDYTGRIAEGAIWNKALDSGERASYLAGNSASGIAAANLIGYWPMSSSDITNLGVDTGGDLTASGDAAFDADHPTIITAGGRKGAMMMTKIG